MRIIGALLKTIQCSKDESQPLCEEHGTVGNLYRIFCPRCDGELLTYTPAVFLANKEGNVVRIVVQERDPLVQWEFPHSHVSLRNEHVQLTKSSGPFRLVD